jgi:hypothetical protein
VVRVEDSGRSFRILAWIVEAKVAFVRVAALISPYQLVSKMV